MAYALAKEQESFIQRMVRLGRFNSRSEVVREALRRMEREEASYLNPPRLSDKQAKELYGDSPQAEQRERVGAKTRKRHVRRLVQKSGLGFGDV